MQHLIGDFYECIQLVVEPSCDVLDCRLRFRNSLDSSEIFHSTTYVSNSVSLIDIQLDHPYWWLEIWKLYCADALENWIVSEDRIFRMYRSIYPIRLTFFFYELYCTCALGIRTFSHFLHHWSQSKPNERLYQLILYQLNGENPGCFSIQVTFLQGLSCPSP